ncbi:MAG: DUF1549 domain-containing protein [Planctomycetaceae bacterium]|nr:DUF1549 domain-containing protein [Planctomycetaceae bacterium]
MSRPLFLLSLVLTLTATAVTDEVPLHQRIDRLITTAEPGPVAHQCDDATFVRRATLALSGRIPTRDEVVEFLHDPAQDKRTIKLNDLLQSDDFFRHMAVTLELMLMERRSGTHVKTSDFRQYLEAALRARKSWLDIACEVLSVDGSATPPAAAGFLLQRNVEPHLLTRDTGRIFFGMDLQCAQCHDHPLIDDYRQDDYYGLNAFFVRATLFQLDKKKPAQISEKAAGEATFKSVFTDREGNMRPRIPGGSELTGASLQPHRRYRVFPAKNVRAVPVDSRLSRLAQTLREVPSVPFDRNIANRLWAHMFGRGLVHPVDLHHSANPPSHPELLTLLASELRHHHHDIAWLLREIALSQTWQRSFQLPHPAQAQAPLPSNHTDTAADANALFQQADEHDARYAELLDQVDTAVARGKTVFDAEARAVKNVEAAIQSRNAAQTQFHKARSKTDQAQQALATLRKSSASVASCAELLGDHTLTELVTELAAVVKKQEAVVPKLQAAMSAEQKKLSDAQSKLDAVVAATQPAILATVPIDNEIRKLRRAAYEQRLKAQTLRTDAEAETKRQAHLAITGRMLELGKTEEHLAAQLAADEATQSTLQSELQMMNGDLADAKTEHERRKADVAKWRGRLQAQEAFVTAFAVQQKAIADAVSSVHQLSAALPNLTEAGQVLSNLENAMAAAERELQKHQRMLNEGQKAYEPVRDASTSALMAMQQAELRVEKLERQLRPVRQSQQQLREQIASTRQQLAQLADEASKSPLNRFAAARLTGLTPEQLAWSLLTATGQSERQRASVAAKLDKDQPLSEEQKQDPRVLQERTRQIDLNTHKALESTVARFATLYGASAGQPQDQFFATVDQSLFLANGADIRGWLVPNAGNLTDRVNRLSDPVAAAKELYLSVLSRPPTDEETTDVVEYLKQSRNTAQAVRELAWGLLTSAEFRFQH